MDGGFDDAVGAVGEEDVIYMFLVFGWLFLNL